jgi:hypothetical protein
MEAGEVAVGGADRLGVRVPKLIRDGDEGRTALHQLACICVSEAMEGEFARQAGVNPGLLKVWERLKNLAL